MSDYIFKLYRIRFTPETSQNASTPPAQTATGAINLPLEIMNRDKSITVPLDDTVGLCYAERSMTSPMAVQPRMLWYIGKRQ